MKGLLQCYGIDTGSTHDLSMLLEDLENETELSKQTVSFIHNLARYDQRLRYKNLKNDPTIEEAKVAISDTNLIMNEIGNHPMCSTFMREAKEVYNKLLKANVDK
jgi:HEPN domain-containing protein